jgi:putative ABC transport system ATP-binding protein
LQLHATEPASSRPQAPARGLLGRPRTGLAERERPDAGPVEEEERQVLVVHRVSKEYGVGASRVQALRSVSLSVARGRFVALMGPSGSGKTTLLHLIAGLERATSGTIRVGDHLLDEMAEEAIVRWRARSVGLVFQFFNLLPGLSARDNVALPLQLVRLPRRERQKRAEAALDLVGLADRAAHFPRTLSGGEQQRVAIARALAADPELVIADEPTGELDAANAEEVLALLRTLRDHLGKTVVMVTHDDRALRYVDAVHYLDKGTLRSGDELPSAGEHRSPMALRAAAGGP